MPRTAPAKRKTMANLDLVEVYTTHDANDAEIVRIGLENEGIRCEIEGEGQAGLTGILSIRVLVAKKDEKRARAYIEESTPE